MSKDQRHPWRQPLQLDDLFLYQLARLMSAAGSMVVRLCEGGYGITRREWRMIGLLAEKGPLRPSQLAEHAQLDRTRTSRTISGLIEKGLLQKQSIAADRRQALVQLTSSGIKLHGQLFPQVQAINQELLGDVSDAELQMLSTVFERIGQTAAGMEQRGDFPKAERRLGRAYVTKAPKD